MCTQLEIDKMWTEKEKIGKYFGFHQNAPKNVEHEYDGDTNWSWSTWNGPKF